ncbi:PH domain-containing protein [Arcanobacterium hippocoleae]
MGIMLHAGVFSMLGLRSMKQDRQNRTMSFEYLPPMKESSLPDEPRYVLRGRNQFWKFAVFVAFSAFFAVVIYLDRASHATVEPVLVALGISVMAYYWYLVPYFEVTPVGLRLVNVFSTREIHWEIFRNVDTRFGLVVASEADVCTDSASFSKPENSGGVQGSAGESSGGGKFRKPRLYRDSVGAFPARAKYVQGSGLRCGIKLVCMNCKLPSLRFRNWFMECVSCIGSTRIRKIFIADRRSGQ